MMTLGQCKECVYFRLGAPATEERPFEVGSCMRFPPVPVCVRPGVPPEPGSDVMLPAVGYKWESVWPTVLGEMGCGEFKARGGEH